MSTIKSMKLMLKKWLFEGGRIMHGLGHRLLIKDQTERLHHFLEYAAFLQDDQELKGIASFVSRKGPRLIPYAWVDDYLNMPVDVQTDRQGRPYTAIDGVKNFFPARMKKEEIRYRVRQALWEQDDRSPHRYDHQGDGVCGDTAVFVGASDCIFASRVHRRFEKIVVFEPDSLWRDSIRNTLSGFSGCDSEIIEQAVGERNTASTVTLDSVFKDRLQSIDFIQADIEGGEIGMLKGAFRLLETSKRMRLSVCCYHHAAHELEISDILKRFGFKVCTTPGYILPFTEYPLAYPYVRRGVVQAVKAGHLF